MMGNDNASHSGRVSGVLFVCMGNICRSPTAEGVFRKLRHDFAPQLDLHVDSAGTHAYHVDEPPDERARLAARARGIDISRHRGRVVTGGDFYAFDYILAMDKENLRRLLNLQPHDSRAEVHLLLEFAGNCPVDEVPDPYYDGPHGFNQVLDLVEQGGMGLLAHICKTQSIALELR
ncbi:MAG: low molecular weight protein-tyrosine-phosphatase [Gammaproteobacteria bacterium]